MSDSNQGMPSSRSAETQNQTSTLPPANEGPPTPQSAPAGQQLERSIQPIPGPQAAEIFQPESRSDLIARARTFLSSSQVRNQDIAAKRAFLVEKGLNEREVEQLVSEMPLQIPTIPPKTYPQGRPSHLPVLLLGLARLFSWLAGGSAALIIIYYRFLLPRITATSLARHSLKSHHLSLLRQLTSSLSTMKESQAESFSVLPHPDPSKEPLQYKACSSVADVLRLFGESTEKLDYSKLPEYTLLRCAIKDLTKDKGENPVHPTTEELFQYLEGQLPWLLSEEGFDYESKLWDLLSASPLFGKVPPSSSSGGRENIETSGVTKSHWEYITPAPLSVPPLVESLRDLSSKLPHDVKGRKSPFQHTLQTLSDFTGYISTQVYLPFRPSVSVGTGGVNSIEEDLRREIRALKGLVLNRRSFMPALPRSPSSRTIP